MTGLTVRSSCILLACVCTSCLSQQGFNKFWGSVWSNSGRSSRRIFWEGRADPRRERSRRGRGGAQGRKARTCREGRRSGTACRDPPSIGRHAAETQRGAETRLVHHRRRRHRCRAPGPGGAGWPPWRFPPPPRTGTADGCGVSAGRWAAALGGLRLSSLLCARGTDCAGHSPESGQPPLAPLLCVGQGCAVVGFQPNTPGSVCG